VGGGGGVGSGGGGGGGGCGGSGGGGGGGGSEPAERGDLLCVVGLDGVLGADAALRV